MWKYNLRTTGGIGLTRNFVHAAAELGVISSEDAGHINNMLRQIDLSSTPDSSFIAVMDMACEAIEAKIKDALAEAQAHVELSAADEKKAIETYHAAGHVAGEAMNVLQAAKDRVHGLNTLLAYLN